MQMPNGVESRSPVRVVVKPGYGAEVGMVEMSDVTRKCGILIYERQHPVFYIAEQMYADIIQAAKLLKLHALSIQKNNYVGLICRIELPDRTDGAHQAR